MGCLDRLQATHFSKGAKKHDRENNERCKVDEKGLFGLIPMVNGKGNSTKG